MNLKSTLRDGASAIAFLAGRDAKSTAKAALRAESGDDTDDEKKDDKDKSKKAKAEGDKVPEDCGAADGDDTENGDDDEDKKKDAADGDDTDDKNGDYKDKTDAKASKADDGDKKDGDDDSDEKEMRGSSSVAQARTRERSRCRAIVTSAEAKRNPALANHLAFKTTMTRGEAIEALKEAPASAASSDRSARNPQLAPQGGGEGGSSKQAVASSWDAAMKKQRVEAPARKR